CNHAQPLPGNLPAAVAPDFVLEVAFEIAAAGIVVAEVVAEDGLRNSNKNPSAGSCSRSWPVAESGRRDGSTAACHTGSSAGGLARPKQGCARPHSGSCPGRCRAMSAAAPGGPRCDAP